MPRGNTSALRYAGANSGTLAGTHVSDLVALKKTILLCTERGCHRKFNHRRYSYYKQTEWPTVSGQCDGCKTYTVRGKLYLHSSVAEKCWDIRNRDAFRRDIERGFE